MTLTLTWDLFIIVFFALVMTYSFIVGKHESVKVIVATYIAIVAGQGIGNILERMSGDSQPMLATLGLTIDPTVIAVVKLVIFISAIIFIVIKGGIQVEYEKEHGTVLHLLISALFGFVTAGLLISTLLTFVANVPLLDAGLAETATLSPLLESSKLLQIMVFNQDLWFTLPALLILGVGLISNEPNQE